MDGEPPSFASFWQRSKEAVTKQTVRFVAGTTKTNDGTSEGLHSPPEKIGRRAQVKRAQAEHRQRKITYVQHLEEEIYRLRDATQGAETARDILNEENAHMRTALSQVDIQLQTTADRADSTAYRPKHFSRTVVNIGYDEDVQAISPHPRVEISNVDMAINFILALEHCCYIHVPLDSHQQGCASQESNHALMASTHYLSTAPASVFVSHATRNVPQSESWSSPALALEQLHGLSQNLNVQDFEVTPVQAWFRMVQDDRRMVESVMKEGVMETLKRELGGLVRCKGFGAVIGIDEFERVVEEVLGRNGEACVAVG